MRVVIGYDPNAGTHARIARDVCESMGITVVDMRGEDPIYANTAIHAANMIVSGQADRGILICGTGIGISMAANKVKGIRAACCSDCFSAKYTRLHNSANVLCFGGRVVGAGLACMMVDAFLETGFEGGRHQRRVDKILALEENFGK